MQEGKLGGEDRKGDKTSTEYDKIELSVCDLSGDAFKKTWLTLKELHDKELHRLQTKLTSLRKERLGDGRWTGSAARIKELTEQQKVLNGTIQALREQLRSKTCERCSLTETYKNTLQQEFYDIQQRNLTFITELTTERNKLREENKKLSAKLKSTKKKLSFSESDDDFFPCAQKAGSVFTVRDPPEDSQLLLPFRWKEPSNTEQQKAGEKKKQRRSPEFTFVPRSPDLFDMADPSYEKTASISSKSTTEGSSTQNTPKLFPLIYTQSSQNEHEFQVISNLAEEKVGQSKKIEATAQNTATEKTSTQMDIPWSFSSSATEQNPTTEVVLETSDENTPDNMFSLHSLAEKREKLSSNVFPLDYTSRRKRSSITIPRYNIGYSERDSSYQTPFIQQSTLRKNANESTTGYVADKPPGGDQSPILGSKIKRKARSQSEIRK